MCISAAWLNKHKHRHTIIFHKSHIEKSIRSTFLHLKKNEKTKEIIINKNEGVLKFIR